MSHNYNEFVAGQIIQTGVDRGASVYVLEKNTYGKVTRCRCATAKIPSSVAGYAVGCLLTDTTTGKLYYNSGTTSSCTFNSIGDITAAEIGTAAIISGHISAGQVVAAALANDAVTTSKISDASVTSAKIATGAVLTSAISDAQVTSAKIATGGVLTANISTSQVTNAKLKLSTVSLTFAANATTVSTADAAGLVGATVLGVNRKYASAPTSAAAEDQISVCAVVNSAVVCTLTSGAQVSTVVDVILALA